MFKKRLFEMMTFIVGVMLVFSLVGCDSGDSPGNGNGVVGGGDSSCPSSSILS
jgi:hypothetical protein